MSTVQHFYIFLIRKTSQDQFGVYPFAKMISYFDILTVSPISDLELLLLNSSLESKYLPYFTSTCFIVTVL